MPRVIGILAASVLLLASCTGDDAAAPDAPTATEGPTASPSPLPGGPLASCSNTEGFEISYPSAWVTNEGDVVPSCSQFHPEPFEVPGATDERVAAITAYIDPVPFHEAAAPEEEREAERAVTVVDGMQAVRLAYESGPDDFYPEGTPVSVYAIDLSLGVDDDPGTLFVDAVGLTGFDHDRNQVVLDRMVRTIDITREDVETAPDVIARYEGGGGGFSVEAELRDDDRACLRIPLEGEARCASAPGPDEVERLEVVDLDEPLLAGITGDEVFSVTAHRPDGTTSTFLPAPVPDSDLRAFAFIFGPDEVDGLTWHDVRRRELGGNGP